MTFSPGRALWNQRETVAAARTRLSVLQDVVGHPGDASLYQYFQWFAAVLDWKPDLVVELGRLYGNSTCVFTEAARFLGATRVVSFDLFDDWQRHTVPRLASVTTQDWFAPLDPRVGDVRETDAGRLVGDAGRVLVLWDAHGFEVAEWVLGALLPAIHDRDHLVFMHDISDMRYCNAPVDYGETGLWTGENAVAARMILGRYNSNVAQLISALDFTTRNAIELHTADESLHNDLTGEQVEQLAHLLGASAAQQADWAWFSLNERPGGGAPVFPRFTPPAASDRSWSKEWAHLTRLYLRHMLQPARQAVSRLSAGRGPRG